MGERTFLIVYHDHLNSRFVQAERIASSIKQLVEEDPLFSDEYKTVSSVEMALEQEEEPDAVV